MESSNLQDSNLLEDLSIKELRKKLTTKSNYAELVAEKAKEYGFKLSKFAVYNAIQRNGGEHEDVIKKILISIIREREQRLAAIV